MAINSSRNHSRVTQPESAMMLRPGMVGKSGQTVNDYGVGHHESTPP